MPLNPQHIAIVMPLFGVLLRAVRNRQNYSIAEQAITLMALGLLSWASLDTFKAYNPLFIGVCGLFVGINFTTLISLSISLTPKVVKTVLKGRGLIEENKRDNNE
jgi:hypothetical protein